MLTPCRHSRVFAKPFISAFVHDDGVTCLARNPKLLNSLVRLLHAAYLVCMLSEWDVQCHCTTCMTSPLECAGLRLRRWSDQAMGCAREALPAQAGWAHR